MHVTLLGTPDSVSEELEREFLAEGLAIECRRVALDSPSLPQVFPPGLVVLWEPGGALEHAVGTCRRLGSICSLSRTCLVVLTRRDLAEQEEMILAGASECVSPVGERWAPNLLALSRRMGLPFRTGAPPGGPAASRVPPERALQTLLAATTADLGHDFFRTLVKQLAEAFRVACAMVGEMRPEQDAVQTIAFWSRGAFQENVAYPLRGTPCHNVVSCSICHYADGVSHYFPEDLMLTNFGLRGYLGAALRSTKGEVIGVLAILHDQLLEAGEMDFSLLGAFAARAGAELERIRAHAELERTRDFLRNTLEAVPDPLFVKDRAHRWVAVNSAFCRFMGRPAEELLDRSNIDFLPEHEARTFWMQDEQAFTSGQPGESEQSFTDSTGLPRSILTRRAVVPGADGQPALVAVIRDLTEHKRLETQLRLADRMASMGTLAAGVAHEINNPLAYICSNLTFLSEQLAQETLPPEALPELREVVAETQEGAARVRTIVQDLRTFARSDEERRGPINVHQVIDGALRLVRNEMQRYNTRLERALEPMPAVLGNESRLGQVLVNLLVNALQSFPERRTGSNLIRIATRLSESRRVMVEVEDNGVGMSPEVMQRIFDPFFTTKPVGVGTGLGLAICHTIVQSMGGQIDVRSTQGRGTTFILSLPVFAEEDEDDGPARPDQCLRAHG
ncbi:ATP-binding protein [Archangium sp.]|uniref:ATP-binding protein n=1 Tax=Archangium sp. TaxID=1872627 RepID=UPI002D77A8DC|nr:ATP-binding protein [Archangium sp.]